MRQLCIFSLFVIFSSGFDASAQSRPEAHWSNFEKRASVCACHLFGRDALMAEGAQIWEDTGSVLIGGNNQFIAQVSCVPGGQSIFVSAFSSDSAKAEQVRNNVRARIVRSALIDTCP